LAPAAPGTPEPVGLDGRAADGYVHVLRRLLAIARAGTHYPDAARFDAHLALLGPNGSRGVHHSIDVSPMSGLPTVPQLLGVRADREVALEEREDGKQPLPERTGYHEALLAAELLPTASVDVRLRRREGKRAFLEIVHDRIDAANGCPVRYTVHLSHRGRSVRVTDADIAEPSERFVNLIERNAGADAELAFLLISEMPGVKVEEVVRGQIGPLHLDGVDLPPLLAGVIDSVPGAVILHLAFERAGVEVAEDRCRDPFARLYRQILSKEPRGVVEARRAKLGYSVSKERRLICTPSTAEPLRAALRSAGTPLVVRSR
jgi:hypothetical protein